MRTFRFHFFKIFSLLLLLIAFAQAQRLPVRLYKSADSLGSGTVNSMMRDSRGFLWFCTRDGLSRFDGLKFTTYHFENPASPNITQLIERQNGDYLALAQSGGVYRFNAATAAVDTNESSADSSSLVMKADRVLEQSAAQIIKDSENNLWAADGSGGLLRLREEADGKLTGEPVPLFVPGTNERIGRVNFIMQAHDGSFWILTDRGLMRRFSDGRAFFYMTESNEPLEFFLTAVFEDSDNLIWLGTRLGVVVLKPETLTAESVSFSRKLAPRPSVNGSLPTVEGEAVEFTAGADNLFAQSVRVFYQTSDKRVWLAGKDGLAAFSGGKFSNFNSLNGIGGYLNGIIEDAENNLWIASGNGVYKITSSGFNSFGRAEGLRDTTIHSIYESDNQIYAVNGDWFLSRLGEEDTRIFFETERSPIFERLGEPVWTSPGAFLDSRKSWWFLTPQKLFRFDNAGKFENLARLTPSAVYESRDFHGGSFYRMWEDSGGNIWISNRSANENENALTRWQPSTNEFHTFSAAENYPVERPASAFAEDSQGDLWFGFYYGGLARLRNGKFQLFTTENGLPRGFVTALYIDHKGRLWIATTEDGLGLINEPAAENPRFAHLTTGDGLASNNIRVLTEDDFGRIYAGSVRGIDRVEPETGRVKHFTTESGLPDDFITFALPEKNGKLWFGTRGGLAYLEPKADAPAPAPPIWLGGLRVAGNKQPVSELGQSEIVLPEFNHRQNNLQIDFFSVSFASADRVRYQYRLARGSDEDDDWSKPTTERSVTFANLAPGNYRFQVRAVNADGLTSPAPATLKFTISPPTWQKSWFIALCILAAGAVLFAFERYRAAKLKALKSAFDEIKVSETRFRRLLEQSPLGTVIFAPDGRIRSVNRAYEEFWGITFEQIKDWDFLADPQIVQSGVAEKLRRAFDGEFVTFEPTAYDPKANGANVEISETEPLKWLLAFAYPVVNDRGELREVVLVMEDITEKKTAEERLEKVRMEKARELEMVRKRIAADLHDDIGSSLTQISILSEVMRQNGLTQNGEGEGGAQTLNLIAASSRELVDAMSDIVWAINPAKDHLSDLTGKMRRFTADSFTPCRIRFTFDAPPLTEDLPLGANLRRELFLIFKEAINNIVKHARCRQVEIVLRVEENEIRLIIGDNGCGFGDVKQNGKGGHGLTSMKERAASLDGSLKINSTAAGGTRLEISIPLSPAVISETA